MELEQNEQQTNTVRISVVKDQSTEIKKSAHLELPYQHHNTVQSNNHSSSHLHTHLNTTSSSHFYRLAR